MKDNIFDVIVIGAGHAGSEAALAAARMGAKTLLLTISLDTIAWMPCNSSIGGPGRGQIVREIDALGGEMARLADKFTLHSRRSNTAKGPAVQAPFVIIDRRQYQLAMKYLLEATTNLYIRQALVTDISREDDTLVINSAFSEEFIGKTVILATGTFMTAEVAYGNVREPAGRYAEVSAPEISESLRRLGFRMGRFKTGTSPRIAAKSADVSALEIMVPDAEAEPFSFWTEDFAVKALPCYKTHTTEVTAKLVRDNIQESPILKSGKSFTGARYCPSIEDKVTHSPHRAHHPIFLQPQDEDESELYIQGLSTALAPEIQEALVRSIPGLEHAQIMRPGYAVMYDFIHPDQLLPSLETKVTPGLFTAGQINGTSGYEEAAAQGLMAGINAALKVRGEELFILNRSQAYIGVLIDDLATKGVDEPYRMFTSRTEYRLMLRSDNADLRLSSFGHKLGLIDDERYAKVKQKEEFVAGAPETLRSICVADAVPKHVLREIEARQLYAGYIAQELKQIEGFRATEHTYLPADIDYNRIQGLSKEATEKLSLIRPASIGQAMRIPGLRQTDIQILHIYGKKFHMKLGQVEDVLD